ncbi:hypothetical protein R6Q59_033491 [Mikania micrantha]
MLARRFLLVLALVLALTFEIEWLRNWHPIMRVNTSSKNSFFFFFNKKCNCGIIIITFMKDAGDLEDVKYGHDDPRYYMDALQVRWFINRRLSQQAYPGPYNGGSYGLPPGVPCCGGHTKPVHKQAHVVQPHN